MRCLPNTAALLPNGRVSFRSFRSSLSSVSVIIERSREKSVYGDAKYFKQLEKQTRPRAS